MLVRDFIGLDSDSDLDYDSDPDSIPPDPQSIDLYSTDLRNIDLDAIDTGRFRRRPRKSGFSYDGESLISTTGRAGMLKI